MRTHEAVRGDFKQLGVDLTRRQVSKARMGKGSLPRMAILFIKQGRFKKAAQAIQSI